ncbi:MAG: SLC26A/SulP transporter family protein [Pseudolabrys sp.]|nr:SLC26A/SulP transporter family protein [Pseudolabrys sp.]
MLAVVSAVPDAPVLKETVTSAGSGVGSQTSWLRDVMAGPIVACVALPLCVSAGVLVYSAVGREYVAEGALAGLFCAIVGGIVAGLLRQSSFVATIPTTAPIGLIQASSTAALLGVLHSDASLTLAVLPLMVVLTGLWQIGFAVSGLSRIIKFAPYPVIAGFVTGIGLLIMLNQLPGIFGETSLGSLASSLTSLQIVHPATLVFGALLIVVMLMLGSKAPRVPSLLAGLVIGTCIYHAIKAVRPGLDLGPVIGAISVHSIWSWPPIEPAGVAALWNFDVLRTVVLGAFVLALIGTLDTFLALRLVQQLTDMKTSPRRDLIALGFANMASAVSGGLAVSSGLSTSTSNFLAGGRTRLSTITSALVLLAGTLLLPSVIFSIPIVTLAAILVVVSLRVFDRWVFSNLRVAFSSSDKGSRNHALLDSVVVIIVLAATVLREPIIGAGVGIALSCLIFIARMSRPIIGQRWSGQDVRSKRVRARHQVEVLQGLGARIVVLRLQGVLFFGNTEDLREELRELRGRVDIVILDMSRVTDIDTSGAATLRQVARKLRESGKQLVFCGLKPALERVALDGSRKGDIRLFTDRDAALEWSEEELISAQSGDQAHAEVALANSNLTEGMSDEDLRALDRLLEVESYAPETALCRAGDPSDRLWIIRRGSVSIRVRTAHGDRRLANLGAGCAVGEMGLLDGRPRSAEIHTDTQVDAYVMGADLFATLQREYPQIAQRIVINIAKQLAQRLRDTSEELRLADG